MSSFLTHGFGTETHDAKIAQFARMGLMPSSMLRGREDSILHYGRWSYSPDRLVEIDGSRKDRLTASTQKKFRRWSRRLNGRESNGTGWILREDCGSVQNQMNSFQVKGEPFEGHSHFKSTQEVIQSSNSPYGGKPSSSSPTDIREVSKYDQSHTRISHSQRKDFVDTVGRYEECRIEPPVTRNNRRRTRSQGSYPCYRDGYGHRKHLSVFVRSAPRHGSPTKSRGRGRGYRDRDWYSRSGSRHRYRAERSSSKAGSRPYAHHYRSETAHSSSENNSEKISRCGMNSSPRTSQDNFLKRHCSDPSSEVNRCSMKSSPNISEDKVLKRNSPRKCLTYGSPNRNPSNGFNDKSKSRDSSVRSSSAGSSCSPHQRVPVSPAQKRIDSRSGNRQEETPAMDIKTKENMSPLRRRASEITFPLDVATFFGGKDKRKSSSDRERTPSSGNNPRSNTTGEDKRLDDSKCTLAQSVATPNSQKSGNHRRDSSQGKEVRHIARQSQSIAEDTKVPPKNSKKIKKAAESAQHKSTPDSTPRTKPTHLSRMSSEDLHTTPTSPRRDETKKRRGSPSKSEIKPKTLIKTGLRSAKKDQSRVRRSRDVSSETGRKLVQRTLETFPGFFKQSSPVENDIQLLCEINSCNEEPKSLSQTRQGSLRSCKKNTSESNSISSPGLKKSVSETRERNKHVRRIYDEDSTQPGCKLTAKPVVRLALLNEDHVTRPATRTSPRAQGDGTVRLAEVSPVPSPVKRKCDSTPLNDVPAKTVSRSPVKLETGTDKTSPVKLETAPLRTARSPAKLGAPSPTPSPSKLRIKIKITRSSPAKQTEPTFSIVTRSPAKPEVPVKSPAKTRTTRGVTSTTHHQTVPVAPQQLERVDEEYLQAQRDDADRAVEAAQRNKKRHSRGHRVTTYCDVLGELLERRKYSDLSRTLV